jgi:hypothetical protein
MAEPISDVHLEPNDERKEAELEERAIFKVSSHEIGHLLCADVLGWKAHDVYLQITIGEDDKGAKRVKGDIYMDVTHSDSNKPNKVFYAAGYAAERITGCFTNFHSSEDNSQVCGDLEEATKNALGLIKGREELIRAKSNELVEKLKQQQGTFKIKPEDLELPDLK